jgi:hypothetical protein
MWTGCLFLLGYAHTHSDIDYFTGLFRSVIAYISFALLISVIKEDIWLRTKNKTSRVCRPLNG